MIFIWPVLIFTVLVTVACAAGADELGVTLTYLVASTLLMLALVYPDAGKGWF